MNTKEQKIQAFDPNQPGLLDASVFGLPFSSEESDIILLPVPWEVTVSYGSGASKGPAAIRDASYQVDLLHEEFPDLWKLGIYMEDISQRWEQDSASLALKAKPVISALEKGELLDEAHPLYTEVQAINTACKALKDAVREKTASYLTKGKLVALIGGDHSTPLGYYEALLDQHTSFGILHFDAHMDLRKGYEGFTYSHASIMYNTMQLDGVSRLVQVGIRDFCPEEYDFTQENKHKIKVFSDRYLQQSLFEGESWAQLCETIIDQLPDKVCISFDIDALQAWYCPNTGTPVPGGLSYEQACYLLSRLADSGKEIIGFDLVEVSPGTDEWDGNVGARLLFHLCGVLAKGQKLPTGIPVQF